MECLLQITGGRDTGYGGLGLALVLGRRSGRFGGDAGWALTTTNEEGQKHTPGPRSNTGCLTVFTRAYGHTGMANSKDCLVAQGWSRLVSPWALNGFWPVIPGFRWGGEERFVPLWKVADGETKRTNDERWLVRPWRRLDGTGLGLVVEWVEWEHGGKLGMVEGWKGG